jgi:hypothetical protein
MRPYLRRFSRNFKILNKTSRQTVTSVGQSTAVSQMSSDFQSIFPKHTFEPSAQMCTQSIWTPSNTTCLENLKSLLFTKTVVCQEYKTSVINEWMDGTVHWIKYTTKRNTAIPRENPLPLPLGLPQIPNRLAWDWSRDFAVKCRRLKA